MRGGQNTWRAREMTQTGLGRRRTCATACRVSSRLQASIMANPAWRPLPTPPTTPPLNYAVAASDRERERLYPNHHPHLNYDQPPTTLRGGTLLHKGFYDLLAFIPTPSPSRLLWGAEPRAQGVAGPRYEDLPSRNDPPPRPPASVATPPTSPALPKKARRISKDMVSKPMGFVCVLS